MNLTNDDVAAGILRDRAHVGSSMADIEPMSIDKSVSLSSSLCSKRCHLKLYDFCWCQVS